MYDFLVYITKLPATVITYLMPDEEVYVGVRMHPIVILWLVVLILAGLVGALALTTGGTGRSGFRLVIWLLFLVLVAWAGSRIIDWRLTYVRAVSPAVVPGDTRHDLPEEAFRAPR